MSFDYARWARSINIDADASTARSARATLVAITNLLDEKQACITSTDFLAKSSRQSVRSTLKSLKFLLEIGVISKINSVSVDGRFMLYLVINSEEGSLQRSFVSNQLASTSKKSSGKISITKRAKILSKTGWRCAYCGNDLTEESASIDHIIPRCEGGDNSEDNIVACCRTCNSSKGGRSIELLRQAFRLTGTQLKGVISPSQVIALEAAGAVLPIRKVAKFFFEEISK